MARGKRNNPTDGTRGDATSTNLSVIRAASGESVPQALLPFQVLASSARFGWNGVLAEIGREKDWVADDLSFADHLVAINLDSQPFLVEQEQRRGFTRIMCPPDSLWICPAGHSFTRRTLTPVHYGAVAISIDKIKRVLGDGVELQYENGIIDATLAAVVRSLLVEAGTGGASGAMFAEAVTIAIAWRLARRFARVEALAPRGALQSRLKTVLERIEDTLGSSLTVEALAAEAGLSLAHFSREFKRHTGRSPHDFVMERRLQRARNLLARGQSIAGTAFECGFSDQPHLARLFKARFGVSPKAFVRSLQKRPAR